VRDMEVGGESAGTAGIRSLAQAVAAGLESHHAPVDERVILYRVAKLWNQTRRFDRTDGLLIVTTRLAFLTKSTTITTEFLSFPTQISSTSEPSPGGCALALLSDSR
jgi:hypothetical protein